MNTNHFMNRFWAISHLFRSIVFSLMDISGPKQVVYSRTIWKMVCPYPRTTHKADEIDNFI